jgi:hypothetical protein
MCACVCGGAKRRLKSASSAVSSAVPAFLRTSCGRAHCRKPIAVSAERRDTHRHTHTHTHTHAHTRKHTHAQAQAQARTRAQAQMRSGAGTNGRAPTCESRVICLNARSFFCAWSPSSFSSCVCSSAAPPHGPSRAFPRNLPWPSRGFPLTISRAQRGAGGAASAAPVQTKRGKGPGPGAGVGGAFAPPGASASRRAA